MLPKRLHCFLKFLNRLWSIVDRSTVLSSADVPHLVPRTILHVDMDAFFAAVEQRDTPALLGKPVLVGGGRGGTGKRGVVTTASYEARVFGCRSAMPMAQARGLCPHAAVMPVRMGVYSGISKQVMAVLVEFSPDVEPVSIDEAFIDVTSTLHLFGTGPEIARAIKRRIRETTHLAATVGVAPNKFLAKVASDMAKPDGVGVITTENAAATLAPMSVRTLFGVGPKTGARLEKLGIRTIADFLVADEGVLHRTLGDQTALWRRLAAGEDDRSVNPRAQQKSIGKEQTFDDDIADPARLRAVLMGQVEAIARQLREEKLLARRITLKLRSPDFHTVTRAATLYSPTDTTADLWAAASALFDAWLADERTPLRLLGASLGGLTPGAQLDLFEPPRAPKTRAIDATMDTIAARFGNASIGRGTGLASGKPRPRPSGGPPRASKSRPRPGPGGQVEYD